MKCNFKTFLKEHYRNYDHVGKDFEDIEIGDVAKNLDGKPYGEIIDKFSYSSAQGDSLDNYKDFLYKHSEKDVSKTINKIGNMLDNNIDVSDKYIAVKNNGLINLSSVTI